jgi:hypothetical protein
MFWIAAIAALAGLQRYAVAYGYQGVPRRVAWDSAWKAAVMVALIVAILVVNRLAQN